MIEATFQGGGMYDARGQLIRACVTESGKVLFVDMSRGIYGEFIPSIPVLSASALQTRVMSRYLYNDYESSGEAMQWALTWG